MYARTGTLNARQEQAALLRSEGRAWGEIAAETGFSPRSVRNLALLPHFERRVQELTDARIGDALNLLKRNAVQAAQVVVDLLAVAKRPSKSVVMASEVRLNAARDILDRLGVTAERDSPAPALDLTIGIDFSVIDAAEAAFIATLRAQSAALGESLLSGEPSDPRHDAVRAVSVRSGVLARPEPGADGLEGAADGDESDDRA